MKNLDVFVDWLYARRMKIVVAFVLFAMFSAISVYRADFSENIYDILPLEDDVVQAHIWAGKVFKKSNSLYFAVARNSQTASEQTDEFARRLRKIKGVADVVCSVGKDFDLMELGGFLPTLFDADCAESLKKNLSADILTERFKNLKSGVLQNDYLAKFQLKNDPLGVMSAFSPLLKNAFSFKGAKIEDFKIASNDGKFFLIVLTGNFDCADSRASADFIEKIEDVISSMQKDYQSFSVAYAGGYRISAHNAEVARRSSNVCVAVTIVLMALICIASFRNKFLALMAVVPSLIGSVVAFSVICLSFARVSSISIAFASIAIGVSIDYAVHVLHFIDGVKGKFSIDDAKACIGRLYTPIAIVSGTTIMAFVIMMFFGTSGFLQLGIFGVVGMSVSAFASVFLLPVFLIGRNLKTSDNPAIVEYIGFGLEKFSPVRSLPILAVVLLFGATYCIDYKNLFNGDMSFFNALSGKAKVDEMVLRASFSDALSAKAFLLRSRDVDELLCKNKELQDIVKSSKKLSPFGSQNLLMSNECVVGNLERWRAFWRENFSPEIKKACSNVGVKLDKIMASNQKLVDSASAVSLDDLQKSSLWKMFASNVYIGKSESAMLSTFYVNDEVSNNFLSRFERENSVGAKVISPDYLGARIAEISARWLAYFAVLALLGAVCYLRFALGNFSAVFAVLLPVVFGLYLGIAIFSVLSIKINIINSVFVIFAVCLAQDYAVFVYSAVKNGNSLGRAYSPILVSSATTVAAFGTLAFSAHPAISSLGGASAISIASIAFVVLLFGKQLSKWAVKK